MPASTEGVGRPHVGCAIGVIASVAFLIVAGCGGKGSTATTEKQPVDSFAAQEAAIEKGALFGDQSTPANALLTLVAAAYHEDLQLLQATYPEWQAQGTKPPAEAWRKMRKEYASIRIARSEPLSPTEQNICGVYVTSAGKSEASAVEVFARTGEDWVKLFNTDNVAADWRGQVGKYRKTLGARGVSVTRYVATLSPNFETNTVAMHVICDVRNDGVNDLTELDFDILARENTYGVRVDVAKVSQWPNVTREAVTAPLTFRREALEKPKDVNQEGSDACPKATRVTLLEPLKPRNTARLDFTYSWQATDPGNPDLRMRLFAAAIDGEKEVCLPASCAWLPKVAAIPFPEQRRLREASWAPRAPKASWSLSVSVPMDYTALVLEEAVARTGESQGKRTTNWEGAAPGFPRLMIGRRELVSVKKGELTFDFYAPKSGCDRGYLERCADELAKAHALYTKSYGPLEGKTVRIWANSATQNDLAAHLSIAVGAMFFKPPPRPEYQNGWYSALGDGLAYSWWGAAQNTRGRGSLFLGMALPIVVNAESDASLWGRDRIGQARVWRMCHPWEDRPLFGAEGDNTRIMEEKGALVLDALRSEMGEETFRRTLKEFAQRHAAGGASFFDFLRVCKDVSGTDWSGFFNHWCFGAGWPDYELTKFDSTRQENGAWRTRVTIRNDGRGTITCPLELRTAGGTQREKFKVDEGKTNTFVYETRQQVLSVTIDPDHTTFEGGDRECRLKPLALKGTASGFMLYWRGLARAETGDFDKAIEDISRAADEFSNEAFSYSRGLLYLRQRNEKAARKDLRYFINGYLSSESGRPDIVAFGLFLPSKYPHPAVVGNHILMRLTGHAVALNPAAKDFDAAIRRNIREWQNWWEAHECDWRPAESARTLEPWGLPTLSPPAVAEPPAPPKEIVLTKRDKLVAKTYPLNTFVRSLDGQWSGNLVASDGCCYFFSSTHDAHHGAAMFRFDPRTKEVKMLCEDITRICGEDPAKTVPQGKVHSVMVEASGSLYFGTDIADHSLARRAEYPGAHFMGYDIAGAKFRDYGILLPKCTIYAAVNVDAKRDLGYAITTPFQYPEVEAGGAHLFRINLRSGEKEDLGQLERGCCSCYHMVMDGDGGCWALLFHDGILFRASPGKTTLDRWDNFPFTWYWAEARPDGKTCVFTTTANLASFDMTKPPEAEDSVRHLRTIGPTSLGVAMDQDRVYYVQRANHAQWGPNQGADRDMHLFSAAIDPKVSPGIIDHGLLTDRNGRWPWKIESISTDGKGHLYLVGAWHVEGDEEKTLGIWKNDIGRYCGQFLAEVDLSQDFEPQMHTGGHR